ncbi:MAG TPA: sigma-70 family RNA polymerase sigma factor [Candidatus Polarisedimenticolia bacterium]|nr:sigma-70 family RNA polymerase sigma factor [Candidatus Polarisedimenticolia bacterium]
MLLFGIGADYFIKMNDTELLQAFRKERSEEAFAELVRRYAGLVYSAAKRRVANAAMAEDIMQIVFIRFAKTPPDIQTHGELAGWLHRTTLNVAIDTWRSETRRRNREQQAAVMETNTNSDWEEISPRLDQAVNQLGEEDRQAILLRFFAQKTMRDVGAAMGVSEAAAKMRVGRAVDRLRTQLGAGGVACTAAVLGTVLAERSVEAAPAATVSRLAAMHLQAAGCAAKGGMLKTLSRISKPKLAATAVIVASFCILLVHLHPSEKPAADLQNVSGAKPETIVQPATQTRVRDVSNRFDATAADPSAKATKILFHVLDSVTGAGLPNTSIRYVFFGLGQGEVHNTLTDENGDARLFEPDNPAYKLGPNVFVAAEDHVPKAVSFGVGHAQPTNEYTMKLDPALTAEGIVVNEQGVPVPDVQIYITTPGNVSGQAENIDFRTCPVTNRADGTWTYSYIPRNYPDPFHFILKSPGYATTFAQVPLREVSMNNLVLVINAGTTITGKVTDSQGQAIAKARLKALNSYEDRRKSTHTDESGSFTLSGVSPDPVSSEDPPLQTNSTGDIVIRGMKDIKTGYVNIAVQVDGFAPETKTVTLSDATNTVDFALAPGNILRGHIVDEEGNPISNVVIQTDVCFDPNNLNSEREFDWKTNTDANGAFEWDSAPAGESCYCFDADGYKVISNLRLVADGSDHEIRMAHQQLTQP